MAARKKRDRQRRRRGRFGFLYKLLSFLLVFTAILVGCVIFFRVNQVTVTGNRRYTEAQIVDASGVKVGDNLLLVNKPQTVRSIARRLPYVKSVTPIRLLPDTLELRIVESVAVARIQDGEAWWLVDDRGKLLETGGADLESHLPQIMGLKTLTASLGAMMAVELEEQIKLEGVTSLLSALTKRGMEGGVTTFIDLSGSNVIYFDYGERLTVAVPMSGDFERRVFSLQRVIEVFGEQGEEVVGTLDLTYGDDQARLLPDRWLPESLRPQQDPPADPDPVQTDEPDEDSEPTPGG